MKTSWLVIANSAKADIYSLSLDLVKQNYTLVKTFENPKSRLKTSELAPDQSGQYNASTGGEHATFSHTDAHRDVVVSFANQIAKFIDAERSADKFQNLLLVAEPPFLGKLSRSLSKPTQDLIQAKISKNYVASVANKSLSVDEIVDVIRRELFLQYALI